MTLSCLPTRATLRLDSVRMRRPPMLVITAIATAFPFLSWSAAAFAAPAAATITLAVTSGGSAASTVTKGTTVTLTAAVTAGGAPVTPGTVLFIDTIFGLLTDVGTGQLKSNGTAVLPVRLGLGSHSLQAVFAGTPKAGSATSAASSLDVTGTGTASTALTLMAAPVGAGPQAPYDWGFDFTMQAIAPNGFQDPTGTIELTDSNFSNAVLFTQNLTGGWTYNGGQFTGSATTPPVTGSKPFGIAAGDFNRDGIPDLAVANSATAEVGILLGNGDGTFKSQVAYAAGSGAYAVAVGDFNDDGIPDLAVTNFSANTVSILLGNGDGTFKTQVTYATGNAPNTIAVGDFNHDGILDLAITNEVDNTVSILLGKGDGTFQAQKTYPVGDTPIALGTSDLTGNGNLDLVVVNNAGGSVSVLMGDGDGTFGTQKTYAVGNGPTSIAIADLNGDGISDLAVTNSTDETISVLLGQSGGSFASQVTYACTSNCDAIVAGNLSSMGHTDLGVSDVDGNLWLFENGNGTGVLSKPVEFPSVAGGGLAMVAGDWNGDGLIDLATLGNTNGNVGVWLNQSGPGFQNGTTAVLAGTHYLVLNYSGDSNYSASSAITGPITDNSYPTSLTISGGPNLFRYGSTATFTATLSVPDLVPEVLPNGSWLPEGEPVSFCIGPFNGVSGSCYLTLFGSGTLALGSSNTQYVATIGASNLPVGALTIIAGYNSDGVLAEAGSSNSVSVTVQPASPAVTWPTPADIAYGTALSATQLDATANVPGTFAYSPAAGTILSYGSHALSVTFTPTDATDYTPATGSVNIAVFGVGMFSGASPSATVTPGGTATYTLSVTPPADTSVSLTVTGLPSGATANFNPSSVPAGSAATEVTLTITVPAQSAAAVPDGAGRSGRRPVALGLVLLPLLGLWRLCKARRVLAVLLVCVTGVAGLALLSGCGGGNNSSVGGGGQQQPQTYNLTVKATAGSALSTTALTLTVQ